MQFSRLKRVAGTASLLTFMVSGPLLTAMPAVAAEPAPTTIVMKLKAQNNSGESGTAMLKADGVKTKVTLALTGAPANVEQPAHVHLGSCAAIGEVKYPLTSVVNGASETTLDVALADILAGLPLAINVHKSVAEASVYVACGDIKAPAEAKRELDLSCMQDAVEKRDGAVITGFGAYSGTVTGGLTARKTALKAGWGITDKKERRQALKTAWDAWKKTRREARTAMNKAKRDAWKQFAKDRRACGTTGVSDDHTGEGVDEQL